MSFSLAIIVVLGFGVIVIGLVAYSLVQRLDAVETAVLGGLSVPSRQLSREEFGRRFATAEARAELAKEVGTATVVFVDPVADVTQDLLAVLDNMAQPRGFVVAVSHGTVPVPDDVGIIADVDNRLGPLGILALPYVFVVDDGTIVGSRPVGSVDAVRSFLLEVA